MDSIHNLALKGHFEQLKSQVNSGSLDQIATRRLTALLEEVNTYFLKKQQSGNLDDEGVQLLSKINRYISGGDLSIPERIPMKKAGGKQRNSGSRKTGS